MRHRARCLLAAICRAARATRRLPGAGAGAAQKFWRARRIVWTGGYAGAEPRSRACLPARGRRFAVSSRDHVCAVEYGAAARPACKGAGDWAWPGTCSPPSSCRGSSSSSGYSKGWLKNITMLKMLGKTNIDFIGPRYVCMIGSVILDRPRPARHGVPRQGHVQHRLHRGDAGYDRSERERPDRQGAAGCEAARVQGLLRTETTWCSAVPRGNRLVRPCPAPSRPSRCCRPGTRGTFRPRRPRRSRRPTGPACSVT